MTTAVNLPSDATLHATSHPTIYLKDYTPPPFAVTRVDLTIQLFEEYALVHGRQVLERQHPGELRLYGRDLELLALSLNGTPLTATEYCLDAEQLVLNHAPDQVILDISVKIFPQTNTQLEGLYQAGDLFVTQNEPEGFRKIMFYPDRPDVLAVFTTRLEADRRYRTLLANGNLMASGELPQGRHFAVWHDPTKKPSYLFAAVIGNLEVMADEFTTLEGRKVALEIYALGRDLPKCHIAMQALKDAMRWDEQHYGRAYDLDNYMIVAVSQFNMGAMENKGLNIFNTACVLADPEVTTDPAIFYVKSTIAHEYFHNWTGNRITCRDWFQLCLKEGFTVFRDQSFSNTLQSAAVQRIDDVSSLKTVQFSEDAGPLSHPPRPDHFVEINNFYTATVYDKGAEIVRMMASLLGPQRFRQGTDTFFARHDGQAVTVEDLIDSLTDGSGVDLQPFLRWYSQPGTPCVKGSGHYDARANTYTLTLSQSTGKRPNYPEPQPLPIPVQLALFDATRGEQMVLHSADLVQNQVKEGVWVLAQSEQRIVFEQVNARPVVSLLRDFSAPVLLEFAYDSQELALLLAVETNGFNQWQAAQTLLERILLQQESPEVYLEAITRAIPVTAATDPLLASRLLEVPTENYLMSRLEQQVNPRQIHQQREAILNAIALRLQDYWPAAYAALPIVAFADNSLEMGKRAYRNVVLAMAFRAGIAEAEAWALAQYEHALCMTERLGALRQLVWNQSAHAQEKLNDFYNRYVNENLAIDQWFGVQAASPHADAASVNQLTLHADFDWATPNRIRAVTGFFAANPVAVWTIEGMQFYADMAKRLDGQNPVLASRVLQTLTRWYTLIEPQRSQARHILQALNGQVHSTSVCETLHHLLEAG